MPETTPDKIKKPILVPVVIFYLAASGRASWTGSLLDSLVDHTEILKILSVSKSWLSLPNDSNARLHHKLFSRVN